MVNMNIEPNKIKCFLLQFGLSFAGKTHHICCKTSYNLPMVWIVFMLFFVHTMQLC